MEDPEVYEPGRYSEDLGSLKSQCCGLRARKGLGV